MRTVVTGGNGFIGSHLVKALIDEGREVVIASDFERDGAGHLADLNIKRKAFSLKGGNLVRYSAALKAVEGASSVFHLAARVGGLVYLHGGEVSELAALQENLAIDANVFRACLEQGVGRLVYASSTAVYSVSRQNCYDAVFSESEFSSLDPDGGYGWSKLIGEVQLGWLKKLKTGIARIFNIYGVNEPLDPVRAHAVADISRKVLTAGRKPVVIAGDGRQTRDFLYVTDCVNALLRLEKAASNPPVVVNVGSGTPVSIGYLANKIVELSGKRTKLVFEPYLPCGPLSRTADISRAKDLLGWQPEVSFDDGLAQTFAWIRRKLGK